MRKLPKQKLLYYYQQKNLPLSDLAKIFRCAKETIYKNLEAYSIPRRKHFLIYIPSKKLIDLYLNKNKSTEEIGQIFNCSPRTILCRLKSLGVNIKGARIKTSKKELRKLYINEDLSWKEIALKYGCTKEAVWKILKRYGIPPKNKIHRYKVNLSFFKKVNEKVAYILGFIYADGYIYRDLTRVRIKIKDKDLLEKMSKAMNSTYPIKNDSLKYWYFEISRKSIIRDLLKYKLTPNKSKTMRFPNISKQYIPHFIRGYFDGDGSITSSGNGKSFRVVFAGNKNFLDDICNNLRQNGINCTKPHKEKNIYAFSLSVKNSLLFYRYIYNNATIYMKRKNKRFSKYVIRYVNETVKNLLSHRRMDRLFSVAYFISTLNMKQTSSQTNLWK